MYDDTATRRVRSALDTSLSPAVVVTVMTFLPMVCTLAPNLDSNALLA
jgi:hypothetical protein